MQKNSRLVRENTKELHDLTEQVFDSQRIFDGTFSPQQYDLLLAASLAYIRNIKNASQEHWPFYHTILERKETAIIQDISPTVLTCLAKFENQESTRRNKYYILGKIYVILGSMLGNSVIYKHISSLPTFSNHALQYLSLHQDEIPALWKPFVEQVDSLAQDDFSKFLQGAKDGYLSLIDVARDLSPSLNSPVDSR